MTLLRRDFVKVWIRLRFLSTESVVLNWLKTDSQQGIICRAILHTDESSNSWLSDLDPYFGLIFEFKQVQSAHFQFTLDSISYFLTIN